MTANLNNCATKPFPFRSHLCRRASLRFVFLEEPVVVHVRFADEFFNPFRFGTKRKGSRRYDPWTHPNIRIFYCDVILQISILHTLEALDDMQILCVHETMNLGLVVETNAIHDQRVAFPSSDGVAHPRGIRDYRVRTSVERDHAKRIWVFEDLDDQLWSLNDLERIRRDVSLRNSERLAIRSESR